MYREIEPAKAKAKAPAKLAQLWTAPNIILQEKYDGWRFLIHFGKGLDRTYMSGRRISSKTGKFSEKGLCAPNLHAPAWMQKMGYTVIDGEVLPPVGRQFRDISGIMNVEPSDAAERIAEIGPPRYVAFDLLFFNGADLRGMPQAYRTGKLEELFDPALSLRGRHSWELAQIFTDNLEARYDKFVDDGGEGVILKDADALYGKGWVKVKRCSTLDVICTGFTKAKHGITGKYDDLIGAIEVSAYRDDGSLVEVGQVSGFTDAMRIAVTKNKNKYLGQVMEIKAQEMAKDRLRHPRYKRWRPEANPKDATMVKLLADLAATQTSDDDE